jgi:hypothetical protein
MKNKVFLVAFTSVVLLVSLTCACKQKDKLSANTMTVAIEPRSATLKTNETKVFRALVRNGNGDIIDVNLNWSILGLGSNIGQLSNTFGKETTFTMGTSSVRIAVDYENIRSTAAANREY